MNKDNLIRLVLGILPTTAAKAQQIVEKFEARKISKNEYILKEGALCKESHFIEEGFMRAYTYDLDGNDVTTAFYSAGQTAYDPFSFFKQTPSKENIQAVNKENGNLHVRYAPVGHSNL